MILGVLLILIAWFVKMPLWLSILCTVLGSMRFVCYLIRLIIKWAKALAEADFD